MGMKNLMCEILVDKQKEYIKSLESQIKNKNETILKETQRANEMFQLSYNRKLKIEEQQAEINRLRKALDKILNYNSVKEQTDKYYHIVMDVREIAQMALNGESEER